MLLAAVIGECLVARSSSAASVALGNAMRVLALSLARISLQQLRFFWHCPPAVYSLPRVRHDSYTMKEKGLVTEME
jgi:hypothetical protein